MAEYANIVCNYTGLAPFSRCGHHLPSPICTLNTIVYLAYFLSKFNNLKAAGTFPGDAETSLGTFEVTGAPWTSATEPFTIIINAGEKGDFFYLQFQMQKCLLCFACLL